MSYIHKPVLLNEVINNLNIKPNSNYIDCTVGAGGHSELILQRNSPNGRLLGIDLDTQVLEITKERLSKYGERVVLVNDSYTHIDEIVKDHKFDDVSGIVLDLGISSYQLDISGKGFSFKGDEWLDMRFGNTGKTAYMIVNNYPMKKLTKIFKDYGEDQNAYSIAKNICKTREVTPIATTSQLVDIIRKSVPPYRIYKKKHFATQVFQALRIEVNEEFKNIEIVLEKAINILNKGGRFAVITFHSLEDRIVKTYFKDQSIDCICPPEIPECSCSKKSKIKIINKKVIVPTEEAIQENPRCRSAKLRIIEKI